MNWIILSKSISQQKAKGAVYLPTAPCSDILHSFLFYLRPHPPHGQPEQEKSRHKHHRQHGHTQVGAACELGHHAHEGGSDKGRPLAADIQKAKVFTGFFRRDQLGKVGPGEGLYAALEESHADRQDPELELALHEHGKDGDAGVGQDTDCDQVGGGIFFCQLSKDNGRWEGHDLGHQKGQEKPGGVKPEGSPVGCGHVDDRVDAVDVEEVGHKEDKDLPVLCQLLQSAPQPAKALADHARFLLHIVDLAVFLEERRGSQQPPGSHDEEGNPHGRLHGEPQAPGSQHDPQAYDEGDTAPDIAPGIALGGDLVQPVRLCHVVEHGVIEHKTGGIADPGDHEDDQEAQPGGGDAHGHASDRPHQKGSQEDRFLVVLRVRHSAEHRTDEGHSEGGHGGRVPPVSQVCNRGQPCLLCQIVEIDGNDGGHKQGEGGVAHVIQDPRLFQGSIFLHFPFSPFAQRGLFPPCSHKITSLQVYLRDINLQTEKC